jgi:uncharacterized protein
MGKVLFWVIAVIAVLLALRLLNVSQAKRAAKKRDTAARDESARTGEPMVRCANCGVYLPRQEALPAPQGYRCRDGQCGTKT